MSRTYAASAVFLIRFGIACHAGAQGDGPWPPPDAPRKKTLTAFGSENELLAVLKGYADAVRPRERRAEAGGNLSSGINGLNSDAPPSAPAAAPQAMAKSASPMAGALASKSMANAASESVTNTQTAGVDEGGIVKVHGKHLVMLRRGRLFTVDVDHGQLAPVSMIDAFDPATGGAGSWYDEMLIVDNTIVVIGYSYGRGGTEIGLFDIDNGGQLSYRATYHMRSNDYYSSRNYASRLIGTKLIFYTPMQLNLYGGDFYGSFPAVRKWRPGVQASDFKRIAPATRIYRTDEELDPRAGLALHTVSICDLAKREMECEATAVLGPVGRVFYVSGESVYVWTAGHANRSAFGNTASKSAVFRIPLNGKAPSALKVAGAPIDQFSFLESADNHLNVMVRSEGRGDGMWGAERGAAGSELALLRVPLSMFSDGRDSVSGDYYKPLPNAAGFTLQNRYVGSYLLYGTGSGWGHPQQGAPVNNAYTVRWDNGSGAQPLRLQHNVDRIEAMGSNAVVIGSAGRDLHFTSVQLGREASVAGKYVRENASQGETRSHGFFYKPENVDNGMIGLPIVGDGEPGHRQLYRPSASVLFLQNRSMSLSEVGSLSAQSGSNVNDGCRASCVDWYGNSRPLFVKNRIFALMGYELVEGRLAGSRMVETRRISYAPQPETIMR
jgi:hypothetical protein